jgi:integrase
MRSSEPPQIAESTLFTLARIEDPSLRRRVTAGLNKLRAACKAIGVGEITAHGLRHSAATILLKHVGKDPRDIKELLRHKNIRTMVRYTHVGY